MLNKLVYENIKIQLVNTETHQIDIIRDIVCIGSIFGNDFIPKLETIDINNNFTAFMKAYVDTQNEL